jgi:hypothetical protein
MNKNINQNFILLKQYKSDYFYIALEGTWNFSFLSFTCDTPSTDPELEQALAHKLWKCYISFPFWICAFLKIPLWYELPDDRTKYSLGLSCATPRGMQFQHYAEQNTYPLSKALIHATSNIKKIYPPANNAVWPMCSHNRYYNRQEYFQILCHNKPYLI